MPRGPTHKFYKPNDLSVLLYDPCESWEKTTTISRWLEEFQNVCLQRILNLFWLNMVSNMELHRKTLTLGKPRISICSTRVWGWCVCVCCWGGGGGRFLVVTFLSEKTWAKSIFWQVIFGNEREMFKRKMLSITI